MPGARWGGFLCSFSRSGDVEESDTKVLGGWRVDEKIFRYLSRCLRSPDQQYGVSSELIMGLTIDICGQSQT